MTKLGNINKSFGKQIGIAIANTNGNNVLASTTLPKNNIIIASPVDVDANDIGTYAFFATDNDGNPVRLSYTIKVGNGLNVDSNNTDVIKLSIDNKSLKENNGDLYLSQQDIIDNVTLSIDNSYIFVNTNSLGIATQDNKGIVGIDEYTVKTNQNKKIYVDTENLDKANENQIGIVTSDNKTIHIDSNGVIHVVTENLNYGDSNSIGVVTYDGTTLYTNNGDLTVNTDKLTYTTNTTFGVSKCDNSTITVLDGIYSVNTNNLDKASDKKFGIAKVDETSTTINNDVLSIKNYDNIVNNIDNIKLKIDTIKNRISELSNLTLKTTVNEITEPMIFTFVCNSVTSVNLTKPTYGTFPDDFLQETITAEFTVNTNCPFIITLTYIDNVSPSIYLYEINYDDLDNYPGDLGLYNEFQSTNSVDKILRFSWKCKNYSASNSNESTSTRIKITISYSKDNTVSQTVYYNIVRYNSLYKENKVGKTILVTNSDGRPKIDDTISITETLKTLEPLTVNSDYFKQINGVSESTNGSESTKGNPKFSDPKTDSSFSLITSDL